MMHISIADMMVNRLTPNMHIDSEPAIRSPGLVRSMMSMLASRLWVGTPAHDPRQQTLDAQVERLAALSPHLLVDIGIDPVTREMLDPEQKPQPAEQIVQEIAPTAVIPVRQRVQSVRLRPADRGPQVGALPA